MNNCIVRKLDVDFNNENLPVFRETISIVECADSFFAVGSTAVCTWVNGVLTPGSEDPAKNRIISNVSNVSNKKIMVIFKPLEYGITQLMNSNSYGWQTNIWTGQIAITNSINHVLWEPTSNDNRIVFATGYPKPMKVEIYMYDVTNLTTEQIENTDWDDARFAAYHTETYIYV